MTTKTYKFPEDDPHATDLRKLALKTATVTVLQQCPALLALLPESVVPADETILAKARAMHTVLTEILDRSFFARRIAQKNAQAGLVLAAGALVGLVTVEPGNTVDPPSKTTRKSVMNKEARQLLAAQWLVDAAPSDRRRFSDHEERCLDALRNEILDFLADEDAMEKPRVRLGSSLASTTAGKPIGRVEPGVLTESAAIESGVTNDNDVTEPEDNERITNTESEVATERRSNRQWLVGASAAAIVITGIVTWALTGFGANTPSTVPPGRSGTPSTGSASSATQQSPPFSGSTYTEQQGHLGVVTYTDPFNLSGAGQKIQPLQEVQVSCKVLAPSIPSASPDGYWYRIVSAPWNNQAYAIANTFLNGDPVVGTSNGPQHNTDYNVPDCPADP